MRAREREGVKKGKKIRQDKFLESNRGLGGRRPTEYNEIIRGLGMATRADQI